MINDSYAIVSQIFHKEKIHESQTIILDKINSLEKKIFNEIRNVSTNLNQVLNKMDTLHKKLDQIDYAQIYLREEMENIGRHRDIESIKKCQTYIKKINNILKCISIALSKRSSSHQPTNFSQCDICVTYLKTFRDNLISIDKYIKLATPYLHSFRSSDIRSELVDAFRINKVVQGIEFLSIFMETDEKKSCLKVNGTLEKFTTIFSRIQEEIGEISCFMDDSIREEQLRRPSLQILNIYST